MKRKIRNAVRVATHSQAVTAGWLFAANLATNPAARMAGGFSRRIVIR